jgi:CubicO group peptidase (beta-lactamase class C family)
MPKLPVACLVVLTLTTIGDAVARHPPDRELRQSLSAFIDELRASPYTPPGFVVIVIRGDETVFEQAYGTRDSASGAPMTLDTPIYNASTTKAYTGLLAAILDEEGVLSLGASVKDVWPVMPPSPAFDPAAIRATALLAHSSGIHEGGIQVRSNVTGQIAMADVPFLLARYGVKREPGFRYANFGPYVWSAMSETKAGVPWRDLVARKVFAPLGLKRTTARLEDFPIADFAHCHARWNGKWQSLPLKPTPILNAAGGIYTSARDTGTFLKAFVTDGRSARGAVSSTALRRTWRLEATQNRDMWGMHRDGYGLGWDLGSFGKHRFVSRSGGADGCRAMALFLPEHQLGIAVLSVGDAAVNTFNASIFGQAIDLWTSDANAAAHGRERLKEYLTAGAEAFKVANDVYQEVRRAPALEPGLARMAAGTFQHDRLGRFEIEAREGKLTIAGGVFSAELLPAGGDDFHVLRRGVPELEAFHLLRGPNGEVRGFLWDDDEYRRVSAPKQSRHPGRSRRHLHCDLPADDAVSCFANHARM